MKPGSMGKIGYIDLTSRTVSIKEIPEEILRKYLGGRGLAAYLLYNHVGKGADPFGPENALIISSGLLSGHFTAAYGRWHVTGKSPDTGVYGDSNAGGSFGAELKYAGFQHLVITGKAEKPTYVFVHDGEIRLRDASHLWGLDTYQTQLRLWDELQDPDVATACIGPAGEKLVRFACVRHQMKRSAGRTGQGCLMGAKNLKAIAVRGTQGLPVARPEELLKITKRQIDYARGTKIFQIASRWSNLFAWVVANESERVSVRNHQSNFFPEGYGGIDVDIFLNEYSEKMLACQGCAMHCQHRFKIKSGPFAGTVGEGPEWSAQNSLGSRIGNTRWDVSLAILERCNRYGIDMGTFSGYAAWLMECWQRGIITEKDTAGLSLEWGSPEGLIGLVEQVARKEGLGAKISDGVRQAVKNMGPATDPYLHRCGKDLTHEAAEYRVLRATPLGCVTANKGNDHLRGMVNIEFMNLPAPVLENIFGRYVNPDPYAWDTKAWMATWMQNLCTISDATGQCKFWTKWFAPDLAGFEEPLQVMNAVTGWDMTKEELFETAERIWNIERMFNVRDGLGRKSDMPDHVFFEPIKEGARKGMALDPQKWEKLLDEYYEIHGWDREGRPTPQTLKRLGLDGEPTHIL
ncbi:MAG: aldehyde ferredoxin oxidoreductase family protein [Chloroflexi bacterium]|nr:aldehyde ferredoxin oxidoreductase family protein [Chloroflexota bacterium]